MRMNNTWILIGIFLIAQTFVAFMPYVTRKTENFGVTIPSSFYQRRDFQTMRKKYAITMVVLLILLTTLLASLQFIFSIRTMYILFTSFMFIYMIVGFLIYLLFHRKMKDIKRTENWQATREQKVIVDTSFRQEKLTISLFWHLIPAVFIVVTVIWSFMMYDHIPDQIPMHTDFAGNVTYDTKSIGNVLFLPGTQIVMFCLFLFIHYLIGKSKQQVSAENPDVSKQQNILFRRRWSAFMVFTGTLVILLLSFLQLSFAYPTLIQYEDIVIFTMVAIILIGTIVLAITTGQGGSRIKIDTSSDETFIDKDDDEHWKLGQFYFNKEDPTIFIEKRFGIGWTNNWAHPLSWILLIGVIVLSVAPILLIIFL